MYIHYSEYTEQLELLENLRVLLYNVPTTSKHGLHQKLITDTYHVYGRRISSNEATSIFVDTIYTNIPNKYLREKAAVIDKG